MCDCLCDVSLVRLWVCLYVYVCVYVFVCTWQVHVHIIFVCSKY